jgi:hypothetical protein
VERDGLRGRCPDAGAALILGRCGGARFLPLAENAMDLKTISLHSDGAVAQLRLNCPERANALDGAMWKELAAAFDWLAADSARVGILAAEGAHFCA